jgi:cysteine desulfurase
MNINRNQMKTPIYLDNHATTKVDPRVLDAMLPYFTEYFGNAASRNHEFGWVAEQAVDKARKQIADLIGATAKEIIFTSGATESNNLAIKGVAEMYAEKGNHIITEATEHKAVLDTCKKLEKMGYRVTYLPVMGDGLIDLDMLRESITDKTILVTIMYANNEIGVIQPVAEIGKICRERGVLFHTDGVQAIGKVPVDVNKDNIDIMSMLSLFTSIGTLPIACTPSVWNSTPRSRHSLPISRIGWITPSSLLAYMMLTRIVLSVIASFSISRSIRPSPITGK